MKVPVVTTTAFPRARYPRLVSMPWTASFSTRMRTAFPCRRVIPEVPSRMALELVSLFVALRPGCPHARAFLPIEHAELQTGHVGVPAHLTSECINFPRQVPLRQSAYGRIARHLPDGVQVDGQQEGLSAHSRSCQSGLNTRVACPNYDHIIRLGISERHLATPANGGGRFGCDRCGQPIG